MVYIKFAGKNLEIETPSLKLVVDTEGYLEAKVFSQENEHKNVSGLWNEVAAFVDEVLGGAIRVVNLKPRRKTKLSTVELKVGKFDIVVAPDGYISLDTKNGNQHFGLAISDLNVAFNYWEVDGYETVFMKNYTERGDFSDIARDLLVKHKIAVDAKNTMLEVEDERLYIVAGKGQTVATITPEWLDTRFIVCSGTGYEGEKFYEWALNSVKAYKSTIEYKSEKFGKYRFSFGNFEIVYQIEGHLWIRYDGINFYDDAVVVSKGGIEAGFKADGKVVLDYKREIMNVLDRLIKR